MGTARERGWGTPDGAADGCSPRRVPHPLTPHHGPSWGNRHLTPLLPVLPGLRPITCRGGSSKRGRRPLPCSSSPHRAQNIVGVQLVMVIAREHVNYRTRQSSSACLYLDDETQSPTVVTTAAPWQPCGRVLHPHFQCHVFKGGGRSLGDAVAGLLGALATDNTAKTTRGPFPQ